MLESEVQTRTVCKAAIVLPLPDATSANHNGIRVIASVPPYVLRAYCKDVLSVMLPSNNYGIPNLIRSHAAYLPTEGYISILAS